MSAKAADGVYLQVSGAIATIVIDQAGRHNALQLRTWLKLPALVAAAEHNGEVGLIVLRGAHGNFGAGNDIAELMALSGDPAAAQAFGHAMADAMRAIETAAKPIVMAIQGLCYGASVALALSGDVRLAADDAVFAITPAKLGALYLRSDLHRLISAVGIGRSKKLMYSAEQIGAAEARRIGLVEELAPFDRFESELLRLADAILAGSRYTLRNTKRMMWELGHAAAPRETDESLAPFVDAMAGPDFKEGADAFMTKRPPRFR